MCDCPIYLHVIIVYSTNVEEQRLEAVFKRINDNNLELKGSKCAFFKKEVIYLGHLVSDKEIITDPDRVEAVSNWPVPKSVRDVIKDFDQPLNGMLNSKKRTKKQSKKTPFEWGQAQRKEFLCIKDIILKEN